MQGGFGFLAVGDVEQHTHTPGAFAVEFHGTGSFVDPFDAAVGHHDTELLRQAYRGTHHGVNFKVQIVRVVGVAVPGDQHRVAQQVLGVELVDITHTRTHEVVGARPLARLVQREDHPGHLVGDELELLLALAQRFLHPDAFGDVLDRSFKFSLIHTRSRVLWRHISDTKPLTKPSRSSVATNSERRPCCTYHSVAMSLTPMSNCASSSYPLSRTRAWLARSISPSGVLR